MRSRLGWTLAASLLWVASPALAIPITHTINGSLSNLSANVSATMGITVNTNLGAVNGTASASGPLASTPNGSINVDWGAPVWNSQIDVPAGGATINNPNPGSANGNATLNLFGFIPVNFSLNINVDNIGIGLVTGFSSSTSPLDPVVPGAGPWTGSDVVDIALSAQVDFTGTGPFGITIANMNIPIGPSTVPGIPLVGSLSRLGGNPGTGSRITLPVAGLTIGLGAQPPATFGAPGCEVSTFFCALNVTSVTVTLQSLTLSNINGTIVADSLAIITPEPATALLFGMGAVGAIAALRRRRD